MFLFSIRTWPQTWSFSPLRSPLSEEQQQGRHLIEVVHVRVKLASEELASEG